MFEQYPDVLVPAELQKILRVSRSKIYDLLKTKEIRSKKVGTEYRILKKDAISYIDSR
jgi:excisionase family DNA binding protein